jgi:hypothetical protein
MTAQAATAKAIASGGLGSVFAFMLGDAEFIPLVIVGVFASSSSYFYDWVHRDPKAAGLKELSELVKYIFYGISVMFIVFYICKVYVSTYINLPISSFGFIAALCSASAVSIVEWASSMFKIFVNKKVSK